MSSAGVIAIRPLCDDSILPSFPVHNEESILIHLAMSGSVVPMRVLESDSIESVKLRIQGYKGCVVKNQKLVCGGRVLSRSKSLVRDYGVGHGNVVHLVVQLSDLKVIHVRTSCGQDFTFHVEKNRDIGYVKKQLAKEKIDIDEQEILWEGKQLEDERLINDICKYNNDAVIRLFVRKSAKIRATPVQKNFDLTIVAPQSNDSREYDLAVKQLQHGANGIEYYGSVAKEAASRNLWLEPVIVNPKAAYPCGLLDLVTSTNEGLRKGNYPIRSSEGTGGAYFMMDASGTKYLSVFKPIDEEPMAVNNPRGLPLSVDGEGLKKGTTVGEGALREVAAYILDHPKGGHRSFSGEHKGFAGVPPTLLAMCLHEGFNHPDGVKEKIGSLQMFMENCGSCEDMGPSAFPVEEVHKISVLDIRMANADRHAGNILVNKEEDGRYVLIPIDHGYCLPASFEDCTFDWLYWPQARQPFSPETVNYIKSLDAEEDIALLNFYGWNLPSGCARTFRISTMLLKKGVEKGFTPFSIGNIMCRENLNKKSVIEEIVQEADDLVLPGSSEAAFIETVSQIMDRRLGLFA
ncbi:phosphatidylinositol 4-kinase gamma 4-like [Cynara cardunculus var. scolymus]|uniref:1-phosphatidylinositol 4-kinase n=1 Tax=Cynara cardunculus var. scolymus TaxID=59895 RepID=A0A103XE32_CYNCS|nr:phosphatidylinositol 4-kinase gamma 4-like [Cynara cardunculus var. scolymus]XP_024993249.1 phosphatidylinositol 4-kinase gamma 4-like [Cynara cardunculus var. scolymus]XP_024993250.1 phosphatidylinositol 4-kinase gamma 4-like [Cynara cardunculus var. scolymus]KVH89029.1 Phosphatidylinositol 3-/4-kinase, catalytic domain-containing protein [Cynara cardunculus var. scolymus]